MAMIDHDQLQSFYDVLGHACYSPCECRFSLASTRKGAPLGALGGSDDGPGLTLWRGKGEATRPMS